METTRQHSSQPSGGRQLPESEKIDQIHNDTIKFEPIDLKVNGTKMTYLAVLTKSDC
jgi:hypothetical protein